MTKQPQTDEKIPRVIEREDSGYEPVQDENDFPLGKACDLSGEGNCEACQ